MQPTESEDTSMLYNKIRETERILQAENVGVLRTKQNIILKTLLNPIILPPKAPEEIKDAEDDKPEPMYESSDVPPPIQPPDSVPPVEPAVATEPPAPPSTPEVPPSIDEEIKDDDFLIDDYSEQNLGNVLLHLDGEEVEVEKAVESEEELMDEGLVQGKGAQSEV